MEQALQELCGSLGIERGKPAQVVEAARSKLSLPAPLERSSIKSQIAAVCDAAGVQTQWAASPRPSPGAGATAPVSFPRISVSVRWLEKWAREHEAQLAGKSTEAVVAEMLAPQTRARACSVAEALAGQRLRPELIDDVAMCSGEATCLVSHAWRDSFVDTVGAAIEWGQRQPAPDAAFAWIDAFAVSQHGGGWDTAAGWDRAAVGEIGSALVVLSPWDRPSVLALSKQREILSIVESGVLWTFVLPAKEQARLTAALEADVNAMEQLLRYVTGGGAAEAAEPGVLTPAALSLDEKIQRPVREWCLRTTLTHCKDSADGVKSGEIAALYTHKLAVYLAECDDEDVATLEQAEGLFVEALAAQEEAHGMDYPTTVASREALAALRARLPAEEGVPPRGESIEVIGLPLDGKLQLYKITWRDTYGAIHEATHRYSEFDTLRTTLMSNGGIGEAVRGLPFPGKKWMHGTDVVLERATGLTDFLTELVVTQALVMPRAPGFRDASSPERSLVFEFLHVE